MTAIEAIVQHHKLQSTGTLTLKHGDVLRALTFKRGLVTYIESNLREEALGTLLVKYGRLTEDQLNQIIQEMIAKKVLLGDILITMGLLTPVEVFDYLSKQMYEKLKNCMQMQECDVSFSADVNRNNPEFAVPFYRALLDGLLESYTPERYKKEGAFNRESNLALSEQAKQKINGMQLTTEEVRALRLIDGRSTMSDFIGRSQNKRLAAALLFLLNKLSYLESGTAALKRAAEAHAHEEAVKLQSGTFKVPTATPGAAPAGAPTTGTAAASDKPAAPADANDMYKLLLRMKNCDYFQMLHIPPEAPNSQVERAFTLLCKQHHLGMIEQAYQPADQEQAKQLLDLLAVAYRTLADPKRRLAYSDGLKKAPKTDAPETPKEVDPKLRAEVEILKAEMYLKFNNPKMALEYAAEAIKLNPAEADYHVCLAQAQLKLDIVGGAPPSKKVEESLRQAMELNPQSYKAPLEFGYYFKQIKQLDKAEVFFRKAIEANPKCRQAESELRLIEKRSVKAKPLFGTFRKKNEK